MNVTQKWFAVINSKVRKDSTKEPFWMGFF